MSSPQPPTQPNQEASPVNQECSRTSTPEPGQISEGQQRPTPDPTVDPGPAAAPGPAATPEGNHHFDSEWNNNVGSDPECRHAATLKDIGYYMWTPF